MAGTLLAADITHLFNRTVMLRTVDGDITGKVLAINQLAVVVRSKGNPRIVNLGDIVQYKEIVRPRRARVVRRVVRRFTPEVSVKQHLVDRHGLFVSLANAITNETAHEIHNKINHKDLDHYHREPDEAMDELDENDVQDTGVDDLDD